MDLLKNYLNGNGNKKTALIIRTTSGRSINGKLENIEYEKKSYKIKMEFQGVYFIKEDNIDYFRVITDID